MSKTQAIQNKVEECKNQLHNNVQLALDRQIQIEILDQKANDLNVVASKFESNSTTLRRQKCWNEYKSWIAVIFLGITFLGLTIWFFSTR